MTDLERVLEIDRLISELRQSDVMACWVAARRIGVIVHTLRKSLDIDYVQIDASHYDMILS